MLIRDLAEQFSVSELVERRVRLSLRALALAVLLTAPQPGAGQTTGANADTAENPWRKADLILQEAKRLAGHENDGLLRIAVLTVRTSHQAALYCELHEKYTQALDEAVTQRFRQLFQLYEAYKEGVFDKLLQEHALEPPGDHDPIDGLAKLARNIAQEWHGKKGLVQVEINTTPEARFRELSRVCSQAMEALRPQVGLK